MKWARLGFCQSLELPGEASGSWELSGMGNSLGIFPAKALVPWKIRWDGDPRRVLGITVDFGDPGRIWGSWTILGITGGLGDPGRFCGFQGVLEIPRDFGDPSGFQRWSHGKQESLGTLYSVNTEAELKQGAGITGLWNP